MIAIDWDPGHRTIRMALTGFFTLADMRRCEAELIAAFKAVPDPDRPFNLLFDITGWAVQPRGTADAYQQAFAARDVRVRRAAVVTTSALAAIQARRMLGSIAPSVFVTSEEALAWIAEGASAPEAVRHAST